MSVIKKMICVLCSAALFMTAAGCSVHSAEQSDNTKSESSENNQNTEANVKVLVSYFSCTGTTKGIAKLIAAQAGAELYEIKAADPYTEEDLKYYTGGRADKEQADLSVRPEIAGTVENITRF